MNEGWIGLTEHQDLATSQLFSIEPQADPQKGIGFLNTDTPLGTSEGILPSAMSLAAVHC